MTASSLRTEGMSAASLPLFPQGYFLETDRLILRPPSPDDVEGLWPHVTDPRVTQFLAWDPHPNQETTRTMLQGLIEAQKQARGFHWIVVRSEELIGIVSLIDVRWTFRCWTLNRAELAYWIAPAHQGFGYATEASRRILQFGFQDLGLHKIIVYHVTANPPSGAVAQRLGFRYVGRELEAFQKQGTWHHLEHYEILQREFCNETSKTTNGNSTAVP
jgi:RimJ/RimL family protein N-acetyltransferase